jgi:hypothetical protein
MGVVGILVSARWSEKPASLVPIVVTSKRGGEAMERRETAPCEERRFFSSSPEVKRSVKSLERQ